MTEILLLWHKTTRNKQAYYSGGLSVLWSVAWMFLVYDTPAVHPRISPAERKYIEDATESLDSVKVFYFDLLPEACACSIYPFIDNCSIRKVF